MTEAFRDPDRPLDARVADLLGRLSLAEKVALLHQYQAPVPRLGIGPFRTGTEALHGLARVGPATVFPQAVGLATSWNTDLVRAVGAAVGDEVRGFHHKDPSRVGLNVWAPVVNPLRDPRWGRNEEGYAEDPWLTGQMGTAYASGLRGDHPVYLRTAPTLKHFLGYNNETDRHLTSSNLPPRVLHEYELPAFRAPIEAGAAVAAMASYNLVNGRPAHLSPLIDGELRRWSADEVLVVSDASAASNIAGDQAYHADHAAGYAAAVRAGIDSLTEDDDDPSPTVARLTEALDRGLLDESDVDRAVRRVLTTRFRLGEFDPAERNPYAALTADVVNCAAHQQLAREAARQSIVLLKNEGGLLPLRGGRVAVIGPLADTLHEDWYSGTLPYAVTAYGGLAARVPATFHEGVDRVALRGPDGYAWVDDGTAVRADGATAGRQACFDIFDWGEGVVTLRAAANTMHVGVDDNGVLVSDRPQPGGWVVRETFRLVERGAGHVVLRHVATGRYVAAGEDGTLRAGAEAVEGGTPFTVELVSDGAREAAVAAAGADVAVVVVGNHPMINGRETEDRANLALPPAQDALVRAVRAANPRTVLVVTSGYPYGIGWADRHVPAVLWSAHGGQEYGNALADVLLGAADPGGRLTQTWYRDASELPDLLDYDVIATDATYQYFRGTPLYPFGHGLSYATFAYEDLRLSTVDVDAGGTVEVSVDVVNTGDRAGDEVVQLYTRQRRSAVKQPLRRLRGYRRITLDPGERVTVTFPLRAADLWFWDVTRGTRVVETARHTVQVGRSCVDIALTATLSVRGEEVGPRPTDRPLWAVEHDDYAGTVLLDDEPRRADAVGAAEPAGWIGFQRVDFGAGVARVAARVTSRTREAAGARVTLRLDDPLSGPVASSIVVPTANGRHDWTEVLAPVSGASGVRDLYLSFEAPGATVSSLTFTRGGMEAPSD